ncbi:hypothetical protein [Flagellimonas maritima]|nr:hypothetical protein [Allomuricauda aurantiaca]
MIKPTKRLLEIADEFNFKCVFFVDSGYLLALKKFMKDYPRLKEDYKAVSSQIKFLSQQGHQIQLHIHSHWEDSFYNGTSWIFNLSRYRLDSFTEDEIVDIFKSYSKELKEITGKQPFVYRAGGWCIQPFHKLKKAFMENDIKVDSTVYYKGRNTTPAQWYDFRKAPDKSWWMFETDPCKKETNGRFKEIPISSIKISPFFYWKFILNKVVNHPHHRSFGDGNASKMSRLHALKLLFLPSYSVVSMDGLKSNLLHKAYTDNKHDNFVIIGHPKAFTINSLRKFRSLIKSIKRNNDQITTY